MSAATVLLISVTTGRHAAMVISRDLVIGSAILTR
jgi:hypothetical protein